ncbi:IST1-like protein [Cocos nucifera]|uniref:IST1-like protein n=1 Tax=Cocos nucifera TaxID=13894 RepID=A0A8K0I2Z2_COCNU|nr:IST1-like protein [Cocos nucifera]
MGKKLDFLLRRTSRKISKLKTLLGLTVSRLAILRNHRKVRCAQARGDVVQLLQLGHVDRALLRVEHAIKEQNMMDVYVMIEGYCHLVTERAILLEHQKECPEELREAISSLIFAASRCGDLHELQSARYMFASMFGKEFAAAAIELRNSCGVNPKMIQKLSTRQPSLENRQRVTKEIAAENGIKLDFDEPPPEIPEVDPNLEQRRNQSQPAVNMSLGTTQELSELDRDENSTLRARQKYKDVASAAQAAYESAAYAAAAARTAVEISRSESQGNDFGGPGQSDGERKTGLYEQTRNEDETWTVVRDVEKIHQVQSYSSESEEETPAHNINSTLLQKERIREKFTPWLERSSSSSSSDSTEAPFQDKNMASNELSSPGPRGKEILFDKSEMDDGRGDQRHRRFDLASDECLRDKQRVSYLQPPYRRNPVRYNMNDSLHEEMDKKGWGSKTEDNAAIYYSEARSRTGSVFVDPADKVHMQRSNNGGKKAVSVRTRRGF